MDIGYVREKFSNAVDCLATDPCRITERLVPAFLKFWNLQPGDVPAEIRKDLQFIKDAMNS